MPTQQPQQPQQPAAPDPLSGPGPVAAFVQPLGIGLLVALAFVLTYLAALHKPQPHHLPVGVIAPPDVVAQLQRSISARTGDAVDLRPAVEVTAARHQLERGRIVAAYLPGQGQADRLLVAGAQGTAVTQTVTGIFTHAAQGQGRRLQVEDVVPLSAEDPRGFSGFYVVFGVTLAGFIFGQTSHTYSRRLPLGRRLIQTLGFAVLAEAPRAPRADAGRLQDDQSRPRGCDPQGAGGRAQRSGSAARGKDHQCR